MIHKNTGIMNTHQNKIIEKILMDDVDQPQPSQQLTFSFEVCIDIGDGRKGVIKVDEKSDPLLCALQFCHDYGLDEVIAGILCQSIKEKIDNERKNTQKSFSQEKPSRMLNRSNVFGNEEDGSMHGLRDSSILNKLGNSVNMRPQARSQHHHTPSQHTKENLDESEFSYKPRINEISKIITEKLQKRSIVEQVELNKRRKELKVEKLKKEQEQKELANCSFKPRINLISQKVDSQIKKECSGAKRYEQLYRNSFVIQRNKQHQRNKSSENMTFKPEINRNSKVLVNGLTFEQRQEKFKHAKHNSMTPNPTPKTGRGPRNRNTAGMTIGEYLYQKSKAKKEKLPLKTEAPDYRICALGKSQDIVNHLRQARLKQIFQQLDMDQDGRIRYEQIYSEVLQPQILEIFLPILEEMRQLDIELDRSQFVQAADRLLSSLTPQQRNRILNTRKRPQKPEPYSFKPQINKKSLCSIQYTQDLYTRGLQDKKKLKDKLERQKEEHARIEFNQCTFKPKILKYTNNTYSTLN